jgi:hypothetical protein
MRIGILNNNNHTHTVCRTNGTKINISAKSFVIIDTDVEQEINYWTNLSKTITDKIGISVLTNESDILSLELNKHTFSNDMKYTDVSIVGDSVSPIAKEIAESTKKQLSDDYFYTKEELLQMDKEDLFNLCDSFNIKYRKNSSVKTLANLILESGVL